MTDMMSGAKNAEDPKPESGLDGLDEQLVAQLVSHAKAGGLKLTGEGGVLQATQRHSSDHAGTTERFRLSRARATKLTR
jgi:hypothetical protein